MEVAALTQNVKSQSQDCINTKKAGKLHIYNEITGGLRPIHTHHASTPHAYERYKCYGLRMHF